MLAKLICLGVLLSTTQAFADSDGERAALARLVGEIDQLAPLLSEAEAKADSKDRVRFGYAWLREDLDKVKAGIRSHLDRPRTEPQAVEPLLGEYR